MVSLAFLCPQPCVPIGDVQPQLVRPLNDQLSLLGAKVVSNLNGILLVVHEQHFQIRRIPNNEFVETVPHSEACLLVRSVTNVRHQGCALEPSAHGAINTPRLTPALVHPLETIGLETREGLHTLLDNLALVY